jgi:hypothetical protein
MPNGACALNGWRNKMINKQIEQGDVRATGLEALAFG